MATKWETFVTCVAGKNLFGVIRYIDVNGTPDYETRGGLWETADEAGRLADMLNKDEEVFEDDSIDEF